MTTVAREHSLETSTWPTRLQLITAVCSIVFTIGTTLQNFVIINTDTLIQMMVLAGKTPADAADAAPGFLVGFRIVGCLYIVGNALGILAVLRRSWTWLFWVVIAVNLTQAAGVVMVPPEVFEASIDEFGPAGVLPSIVTDGGALLLTLLLLGFFVRYRRPWARPRSGPPSASGSAQ
jgi:hypothetical protein